MAWKREVKRTRATTSSKMKKGTRLSFSFTCVHRDQATPLYPLSVCMSLYKHTHIHNKQDVYIFVSKKTSVQHEVGEVFQDQVFFFIFFCSFFFDTIYELKLSMRFETSEISFDFSREIYSLSLSLLRYIIHDI